RLTDKIGIRASDISNSDELSHTDNTTLIPPRLPDTLPQVYHRRCLTLGLLIFPSVLPFPPTIKRIARMSVLPIEPNLAERARISAINLDDYQLDPVTPPPSPSSPFSGRKLDMDHYLNACLEELEAFLTLWDVNPRVEESSLEALSVDKLITQLRQVCEDAEDRASNTQEEARQKRNEALKEVVQRIYLMHENFHGTEGAVGLTRWFEKLESQFRISNVAEGDRVKFASSTLLDSALTWWNVYVRSVTLDTAHATPWSDFKAMFIQKYYPRNEVKQIENELWNLKGNVTSSKPVDLHEAIEMAQGLMYQVVQELGENSGDKQKWNGNHYNNNNPNTTSNLNPNKCTEIARVFIAGQGSYVGKLPYCGKCGRHHTDACPLTCHNCRRAGHKVKDCRAPPRPVSQRGPGSQGGQGSDVTCFRCSEKGHYKNKCPNNGSQGRGNQIQGNQQNPQNNQRQNQGNPKGNNQASTST
ncbi:reverse transcriptase domain-containing protein, partial [Tanacetum coccineum]